MKSDSTCLLFDLYSTTCFEVIPSRSRFDHPKWGQRSQPFKLVVHPLFTLHYLGNTFLLLHPKNNFSHICWMLHNWWIFVLSDIQPWFDPWITNMDYLCWCMQVNFNFNLTRLTMAKIASKRLIISTFKYTLMCFSSILFYFLPSTDQLTPK